MGPEVNDETGPGSQGMGLSVPMGPVVGLRWTEQRPDEAGWYGLRHATFQTALGMWHEPRTTIVEMVPDATGRLLIYVAGTTWTRAVADLVVGEWMGPLNLPE
ncbi:MAG: hypothetical protein ABI856_15065 [Nitrospira sp.]